MSRSSLVVSYSIGPVQTHLIALAGASAAAPMLSSAALSNSASCSA